MEPSRSFNHATLKLAWSKTRLEEFEGRCAAFLASKPEAVRMEEHDVVGGYGVKVGLSRPITPDIPLSLGDVVSNLRAALDIAWMGLIRAANPHVKEKRTWPIATNEKDLVATVGKAPLGSAQETAEFVLANQVKSHRDFANGGNRDLVALNELSNWNKHNLLILQQHRTAVKNLAVGGITIRDSVVTGDGMTGVLGVGSQPMEFSFEGQPKAELVFGDHELVRLKPVVPAVLMMMNAALEAVRALCDAFPDPGNPRFIDNP